LRGVNRRGGNAARGEARAHRRGVAARGSVVVVWRLCRGAAKNAAERSSAALQKVARRQQRQRWRGERCARAARQTVAAPVYVTQRVWYRTQEGSAAGARRAVERREMRAQARKPVCSSPRRPLTARSGSEYAGVAAPRVVPRSERRRGEVR